jgi:squalene cyclase
VAVILAAAILAGTAPMAAAQRGVEIEDLALRNQQAVERGLEFLAARQNPDGSWYSNVGFKLNDTYQVTNDEEQQRRAGGGHVGVTALACMSFMAGGNLPGRGKYGRNIEAGLEYILDSVKEDGYITDNGTRMYSHAFATLFLAEIYGMTHRKDVQVKLQMAVDLIVKSQNKWGSWRYLPFAPDSDMSITVCQIMALRAARNIGIRVPRSTIDRAIQYVLRSAFRTGPQRGGFKYQLREDQPTRTSFPLTAAGIATLHGAGVYSHDLIEEGLDYLKREFDSLADLRDHYFFFYGHYYAVQAMYIAGGRHWDWYWPRIQSQLVLDQRPDGSWKNNVSPEFGTAVATLILQIPNQYLPIFQR